MTKLSDILSLESTEKEYFGVIVDVDNVVPPENIKKIGFVCSLKDGEIPENLLDIAISYKLVGIDVVLEIPYDNDIVDYRHFMMTIASLGVSVIFLPPSVDDETIFLNWVNNICNVIPVFLKQQNFTKVILPITSFIEYLYIEIINPELASKFSPIDPDIINLYQNVMTPDRISFLKDKMREVIYEEYGDKENFEKVSKAIFSSIYNQVKGMCQEQFETMEKNKQDYLKEQENNKV